MTTLGYERRFNPALRLAAADKEGFVKDILHGQPNPPLYFAAMKRVNRDGIEVTGGVRQGRHLTAESFAELRRDPAVRVLDLRMDKGKFDSGHAAGAISAPLRSSFFSMAAGSFLTERTPLIIIVERESDVDLAVRQLYRIGLDQLVGWMTVEDARSADLLSVQTKRIEFENFDAARARLAGVIVDVRTTAECETRHLEDAHSMPYTRLREHLPTLPRDKTLFVHCASGKRASLAASFLTAEGFNVVHVDGMFGTCGSRCGAGASK